MRIEFPGAIYHVPSRMLGSWRQARDRLLRYAGLRQREIAKLLGMGTGGAVSAQLARLPELIRADRRLERRLRTAEDRLDEKRDKAG